MARRRFRPEEIATVLRQARGGLHGRGMAMADAVR